MKRCFMIGHRDAPESIYPEICAAVERHITEYGTEEFMVGSRGAFDKMAMRAVIQSKEKHPSVRLTLLLAYLPEKGRLEKPSGVDDMYYPEGLETTPRRYAIIRANQKAVDLCDQLIIYAWHPASNARNLLEYARGKVQVTAIGR